MHRYLIERTFAPGVQLLVCAPGGSAQPLFIPAHDTFGVTWLCSYLTSDLGRSYCIVDGPSPEAVRQAARANGLPVDRISEVRVLEPNAPLVTSEPESSQPL
jgi:hypothetical protein